MNNKNWVYSYFKCLTKSVFVFIFQILFVFMRHPGLNLGAAVKIVVTYINNCSMIVTHRQSIKVEENRVRLYIYWFGDRTMLLMTDRASPSSKHTTSIQATLCVQCSCSQINCLRQKNRSSANQGRLLISLLWHISYTYDLSYVLCLISDTLLNTFISCLVVWCRVMIMLHWLARPPRLKAD